MDNPQLDDYRELQRQRYMERMEENKAREEELKKKAKRIEECLQQMSVYCNISKDIKSVKEMHNLMTKVLVTLDSCQKEDIIPKQELMGKGLDILESINSNTNLCIDLRNQVAKEASKQLKEIVKTILTRCGISASDMELEFDMDCSKDEEIAIALAQSFIHNRTPFQRTSQVTTSTATTLPLTAPKKRRGMPPKQRN